MEPITRYSGNKDVNIEQIDNGFIITLHFVDKQEYDYNYIKQRLFLDTMEKVVEKLIEFGNLPKFEN